MGTHNQNGRGMGGYGDRGPSWRPQDQGRDDDDRMHGRDDDYGQGQSGYGAGRFGDDRAMEQMRNRNQGQRPGSFERHERGFGVDDRFAGGRGGDEYWTDRSDRPNPQWDRRDREHDMNIGRRTVGGPGYGSSRDFDRSRDQRPYDDGNRGVRSWNPQDNFGGQTGTQRGPHRGKGPMNFTRSDERIREQVCELLADDDFVDATNIEVTVKAGEVTLAGTVEDRQTKRAVEDIVERASGVKDVHNQLKVGVPSASMTGQNGSGSSKSRS
jgi:hypothetical protein